MQPSLRLTQPTLLWSPDSMMVQVDNLDIAWKLVLSDIMMIMIKGPQLINISLNMILSRSLCGLRPPDRELEENPRSGHWGRQLAL